MLELTLILDGEELIMMGSLPTIKKRAAERLNCEIDQLTFKIKSEDGKLREVIASTDAWQALSKKHKYIYVFVRSKGQKRKSYSMDDGEVATPDYTGSSSSYDTPMRRPTIKKSKSTDKRDTEKATDSGDSRTSSRSRPRVKSVARSGTHWTAKEDTLLFKRLKAAVEALPHPDPVYSPEQKHQLFCDLSQSFGGARSVGSIKDRVSTRIRHAVRKGESIPSRYKALYPPRYSDKTQEKSRSRVVGHHRGNLETDSDEASEEDSSEEEDEEDELEIAESSASDPSPPPSITAITRAPKKPATISNYNPFAKIAAVPPKRATPSWSKPSTTPLPPKGPLQESQSFDSPHSTLAATSASSPSLTTSPTPAVSTSAAASASTTPSRFAASASAASGSSLQSPQSEVGRQSSTSSPDDPVVDEAASSSTQENARDAAITSGLVETTASMEIDSASANDRLPPISQVNSPSVAESSLVPLEVYGNGCQDAIIVKDESEEDELVTDNDQPSASTGVVNGVRLSNRATSVKAEHQSIREAVRAHIHPLFPLQQVDVLPPAQWATSLATWIKAHALQHTSDRQNRLEALIACFDEFFYFAYHSINKDYSEMRASFGVVLLLLDLYHALLDVEELQDALVEIFHQRIFSATAPRPEAKQEWPPYTFCAAATLIFPSRPSWLVSQISERSQHFHIDLVPPPLDQVTSIFSRMWALLQRLSSSEKFRERESSVGLLFSSIHSANIDLKTSSNLKALYRQSRARLSDSDAKIAVDCIAAIDQLNRDALKREDQRKEAEEEFFATRLILISSPHPINVKVIEDLITRYSPSTQITNGPMKKKMTSTHETWHSWIFQFSSQERRKLAIDNLRDFAPNQDVQILNRWENTHSYCRLEAAQIEQQNWHRTCFDLHLHREHHRRAISRVKQESNTA